MKLGKRFSVTLEVVFQAIEPDGDEDMEVALVALAGVPIGTVSFEGTEFESPEVPLQGLLAKNMSWVARGLIGDAHEALFDSEEDEGEEDEEDEDEDDE